MRSLGSSLALGDSGELDNETRDLDGDTVKARLEELEGDTDQLRERARLLDLRMGAYEVGLRDLRDPKAKAAEAAAEAEGALARVRELAERYLAVRVAAIVLGREIERYRQENQGPMLLRASELFRRLTLGSWTRRSTPITTTRINRFSGA